MNIITIELLNKYDKNTKILEISNKDIIGILCLNDFKKLEELNCSFNEITEIINLPYTLKYLTISSYFNQLFENLPSSITHLTLGYDFNQTINVWPSSITHLELVPFIKFFVKQKFLWGSERHYFNQPINNLPSSITHLTLRYSFNHSINNIPNLINQ